MVRRLALAIVALCITAAIAYSLLYTRVPVDAVAVRRGPLEVTIDEEGRTRVKDRYVVDAPVAGRDRRIQLEVGDAVGEGQVLTLIDPAPSTPLDPRSRAEAREEIDAAAAALTASQADVAAAAAEADYARAQYERKQSLYATDLATREDLDRCAAEQRRTAATLRSAEFHAKVAKHRLDVTRARLDHADGGSDDAGDAAPIAVRAPAEGRVLSIHHESAGTVQAGQPLIEIGDPRALEVAVDVLSHQAVKIEPGMPVRFERWGGDRALDGRVRIIEPTAFTKVSALGVEEQRVWVICDITSPPEQWTRLGTGYRVEARFIVWQADDVAQIPTSALFRHGGQSCVFRIEEGRARRRAVELGHRTGLAAELLGSLGEQDAILLRPDDRISDGTRVEVRSWASGPPGS